MNDYCNTCAQIASWLYMPGGDLACDECVPRGCSCNLEPKDGDYDNLDPKNWAEPLDNKRRFFPCCEWEPVD